MRMANPSNGRVLLLPFMEQRQFISSGTRRKPGTVPRIRVLQHGDPNISRSVRSFAAQYDQLFVRHGAWDGFRRTRSAKAKRYYGWHFQTLIFIEMKGANVNWAEPREWDASQQPWPSPGNHHGAVWRRSRMVPSGLSRIPFPRRMSKKSQPAAGERSGSRLLTCQQRLFFDLVAHQLILLAQVELPSAMTGCAQLGPCTWAGLNEPLTFRCFWAWPRLARRPHSDSGRSDSRQHTGRRRNS